MNSSNNESLELTPAIWMVSGVGRIVTLNQTGELSSKQQAMHWMLQNIKKE